MTPIISKETIAEDLKEIDLALSVLNGLREVNLARLVLIQEVERRASESGTPDHEADNGRHL